MNWITSREKAQEGDLALLTGSKQKYFIINLIKGDVLKRTEGL